MCVTCLRREEDNASGDDGEEERDSRTRGRKIDPLDEAPPARARPEPEAVVPKLTRVLVRTCNPYFPLCLYSNLSILPSPPRSQCPNSPPSQTLTSHL